MPGDDEMASLIQKIARQARLTFPGPPAATGGSPAFADNLSRLRKLLGELRAEDLRIAPRGAGPPAAGPPVSYMHICETAGFSMGVFLLRGGGGGGIPLHDHPGMHGLLKVLYGALSVRAFDRLPEGAPAGQPCRALRRSAGLLGPASLACLLAPHRDNLHQISAPDGPAAFLDILAPPYDTEDGRDCHYYRQLPPPGPEEPPADEGEVWLQEIPQPADFWCGAEDYPGPRVSL